MLQPWWVHQENLTVAHILVYFSYHQKFLGLSSDSISYLSSVSKNQKPFYHPLCSSSLVIDANPCPYPIFWMFWHPVLPWGQFLSQGSGWEWGRGWNSYPSYSSLRLPDSGLFSFLEIYSTEVPIRFYHPLFAAIVYQLLGQSPSFFKTGSWRNTRQFLVLWVSATLQNALPSHSLMISKSQSAGLSGTRCLLYS